MVEKKEEKEWTKNQEEASLYVMAYADQNVIVPNILLKNVTVVSNANVGAKKEP